MSKRLLALLIAGTMVLSSLTGCSKDTPPVDSDKEKENVEAKTASTLMWNLGSDPKTFDPTLNGDSAGSYMVGNLFEGLMKETPEGFVPGQAKDYTLSEDGLVYTFHLRDDIKWSDGKPVTAQDFEYSWKRAADPAVGSGYSYMITSYIKNADAYFKGEATRDEVGVKAIDEKTLEVQLTTPVPFFLGLTTFFTFMPVRQDIVEANGEGWEKKPETCIGNGPFILKEYQVGSHVLLGKNENYYAKDEIKLNEIKGLMITEGTTALNAFESGDLHINSVIPPDEVPRLVSEEPNLFNVQRMGTEYIIFNVDAAPVNDVRVRKALTMALDRKAICESVLKGGQIPATGILPPIFTYSDGTNCRKLDDMQSPMEEFGIDPNAAKIDEAKKLLTEAGYPDGKGFPKIVYSYSTSDEKKKIAETMQEMWKTNLGIDVELQNMEWQVLVDARKRGEFVMSAGNWLGDYVDPMTMLDPFASTAGWNEAQWRWQETSSAPHDKTLNPANKAYDEAIQKAQYARGTERDSYLREAESILMEDMPVGPIYYKNGIFLIDQAKVSNVWRDRTGGLVFRDAVMIE